MKKEKKSILNDFKLTNILLLILIVFVFILIVLFVSNQVSKKDINVNMPDENLIDQTQNTPQEIPIVTTTDIDLEDVNLPESELIAEFVLTEENIESLRLTYPFIFNNSLIVEYNFKPTEINDYILEFKDYIIVYDVENEVVKSIWLVQLAQ
jgi:biopolymer transport protein ExbD